MSDGCSEVDVTHQLVAEIGALVNRQRLAGAVSNRAVVNAMMSVAVQCGIRFFGEVPTAEFLRDIADTVERGDWRPRRREDA